ncbi:MAG: Imm17 family immunity protein [Mariniblastus sp.]|nr:Imm17 family immunity protein [Mariniblastus sp.]
MDSRDLLVALISAGLGASLHYAILFNPNWLFRLRTPQMLERNLGRKGARWVLGTLATALILVGLYLAWPSFF